jgi:uncharacterized protein YwqG
MFFWKRWGKPGDSDVRTSVILRRQVPIRFEEQARSWLGGLPMMPQRAKWPRDSAGAPLHFLAQIACADLPSTIWDGAGPREGWLLLFTDVFDIDNECDHTTVRVLHTSEFGVEHEPPRDVTTVRHLMSDYSLDVGHRVRPGVPKLWRKWPVDLVVQEYQAPRDKRELAGPPCISGEQLYNAPVSDAITVHGAIKLDRPFTWRGALYFVEGVLHDLAARLERGSAGHGILIEPPEPDQDAFNAEFKRRWPERSAHLLNQVGCYYPLQAAREALNAELAQERKAGWQQRAFEVIDKEKLRFEAFCVEHRRAIDETPASDQSKRDSETRSLQACLNTLAELERNRAYLNQIFADYPGPDGEARFNEEIRRLGEALPAQFEEQEAEMNRWLSRILAQDDLEAPLPEAEWRALTASVEAKKTTVWSRTIDTSVLKKIEQGLPVNNRHLEMAVREDVLDIYTRDDKAHPALSGEFLDEIEKKLRYIQRPHRMGDVGDLIEREKAEGMTLLFQIWSDGPMGWMWGDLGALNVMISPQDLRRNRFDKVRAWTQMH